MFRKISILGENGTFDVSYDGGFETRVHGFGVLLRSVVSTSKSENFDFSVGDRVIVGEDVFSCDGKDAFITRRIPFPLLRANA